MENTLFQIQIMRMENRFQPCTQLIQMLNILMHIPLQSLQGNWAEKSDS